MSDPQEGEDEAKMVPLAALEDERQKRQALEDDVNYLKGQTAQLAQQQKQPQQAQQAQQAQQPERQYTRAELSNFVSEGKIEQDQADNIMDAQMQRNIEARVSNTLWNENRNREVNNTVSADFNSYIAAIPDINVPGTDARNRLEAEYQKLTKLGQPDNKVTEVLAMRVAFGDHETLKAAKEKSSGSPSHRDIGGGEPPDSQTGSSDEGAPSELTAAEKSYYQGAMKEGIYKNWSDVRDEMKFANKQVRTRTAARGL